MATLSWTEQIAELERHAEQHWPRENLVVFYGCLDAVYRDGTGELGYVDPEAVICLGGWRSAYHDACEQLGRPDLIKYDNDLAVEPWDVYCGIIASRLLTLGVCPSRQSLDEQHRKQAEAHRRSLRDQKWQGRKVHRAVPGKPNNRFHGLSVEDI